MYVSADDLRERFGAEIDQLGDRDGDGAAEVAVIDAAIADASALADGYLATRYVIPVTPAPSLLKGLVADMARFRLWSDRAPEAVRQRHEDALGYLKRVAEGKADLVGAEGESGESENRSVAIAFRRQTVRLDLKGY